MPKNERGNDKMAKTTLERIAEQKMKMGQMENELNDAAQSPAERLGTTA
jgi:hypothetical protein